MPSLFYPYLLLCICGLGVVSNVGSLFVFAKQRFRRNFHRLLVTLAVYDFMVVVLCAMLWAFPMIWPEYQAYYHPYWSKYLLPFVQIALMSSVYCTIIMSWERYVRICLISRFRYDYFSERKFRGYMAFVVIFPILFYIPKFFELQPLKVHESKMVGMTCKELSNFWNMSSIQMNGTIYHLVEEKQVLFDQDISDKCHEIPWGSEEWAESIQMYMAANFTRVIVGETKLVQNPLYYNTYCIAINCIFASLIPFVALTFFNISIVNELRAKNREPNVLVTYLRRGRQRRSIGEQQPQIENKESSTNNGHHHRLCIRFNSGSSPPPHLSKARHDSNDNRASPVEFEDIQLASNQIQPRGENEETKSAQRTLSMGNIRLRRSNSPVCRRREKRLTNISVAIVWLFLFCHIWKLVPTTYEVFYGAETYPSWMFFIKHLSHALIVLNSSLNFLIYVVL